MDARPPDGPPLVRGEQRGPVSVLTLASPANRNALSRRLVAELSAHLDAVRADEGVRVVVLTGAGPSFCSGADLEERLHPPPGKAPVGVSDVLTAIVTLPRPVIARVNGAVRAGGIGLVAACDLAVAPERATFAFSEVRVGVAPAIIAVPSLRRMARRAYERYTLTGEVFGAPEAAACGLLSAAVEDDDALDAWVDGAVASLLSAAPAAVAAAKRLPAELGGPWDEAMAAAVTLSDRMFEGPDAAEGMAAFLEKRPPAWVAEWPQAALPGS